MIFPCDLAILKLETFSDFSFFSLSFLILSWVLVGPGLEFSNIEKNGRGTVSTRLVFIGQEKLTEALSSASEEFLVSLKYGKSICIWRGPD